MALPGDITTITLTGSFAAPTGGAGIGTVSIAPTSTLTDTTGQVILTTQPAIQTLIDGAFSVVLPCTDNVSIRPTPFEYLVTPAVPFAYQEPFAIRIPSTLGSTVDLSALWPIPQPPSPTNGIYVISVNGQSGSAQVAPYNLSGTGAATRWVGATTSGHPTAGTFLIGDWTVDQTGAFWVCTGAGTPGTWVEISGTGGGSGGGAVSSVFGRAGVVVAASGDYTVTQVTGAAPLASPVLTGTPTAPTATALTDNTQVGTTGYTDAAVAVETARATGAEAALLPKTGGTLTGGLAVEGALGTPPVVLTDAATIAVNASLSDFYRVTLGGNRTLGNPTSPTDGQSVTIELIQDATGTRTLAYGASYSFPASIPTPALSTTPGDRDFIAFTYDAGTSLWYCTGWVPQQNAGVVAVVQGGTGQTTLQTAINALAGAQTSGQYLRGTGSNVVMAAIQAADLPAATTSVQGAIQLDGTAGDIQPLGVAAAGAVGKAADAGHIHPVTAAFGVFGDGSDGTATLDGTATVGWASKSGSVYTLTRNAYLAGLTVNNGVTLVMGGAGGTGAGGYQIYCQGTVTNNGTISCNGNPGLAAGTAGGVTGSGANAGGRAGGAGNTTAGTQTAAFGGWACSSSAAGVSTGGAGGLGASGAGGLGALALASQISLWYKNPFYPLMGVYGATSTQTLVCGGQGGGGGGGDGTNRGGGGGSGGGLIVIFAYAVINNGTMSAVGGAGGTPLTGNCGGGGGGGGGAIITFTLIAWTAGTTAVTPGTFGSGVGSGVAGSAGVAGSVFNTVI